MNPTSPGSSPESRPAPSRPSEGDTAPREVDTTGVTGTVLRIEPSRNDWGGTTWTWTCPVCTGVISAHTSDKAKALEWIAKYAPHSHCRPAGETSHG